MRPAVWVMVWVMMRVVRGGAAAAETGSTDVPLEYIGEHPQERGMEKLPNTTKTLVILIDGLRWDAVFSPALPPSSQSSPPLGYSYAPQDESSPLDEASPQSQLLSFTRAQQEGAAAEWNTPVFPTTATANMYTIATGVLPSVHGVLSDEGGGGSSGGQHGWVLSEGVTPLWETAPKEGVKTALLRWIDCTTLRHTSPLLTCADRVSLKGSQNLMVQLMGDAALAADLLTEEDYGLVMLRTELISWTSEHYGPTSVEVLDLVGDVKNVLDDLFEELDDARVWKQLSVFLLSPSGVTDTSPGRRSPVLLLPCLQPPPIVRHASAGAVVVAPAEGVTGEQLAHDLRQCPGVPADALTTHQLADLPPPDRWPGGPEEVLVLAEDGYSLDTDTADAGADDVIPLHSEDGHLQLGLGEKDGQQGRGKMGGAGFARDVKDMNGVFIVKGPGIAHGSTGPRLLQTDVYQLLCHQTGLSPQPHHGRWEIVDWMVQRARAARAGRDTSMVLLTAAVLVVMRYIALQ